jgi:Carbohydrate esterase, sialic acid-specific acetylesterase
MTRLASVLALAALVACGACSKSEEGAPSPVLPVPERSEVDAARVEEDAGGPSDAGTDAPPPILPYFDVNHILSMGQSLSVGSVGSPALSTTQPYDNRMFVTGVLAGGTGLTSFVPLVEGSVETMSSSLANLVTKLARDVDLTSQPEGKRSHELLVSVHGVGGTAYAGLKKGTAPYAAGMAQAKAGMAVATGLGKSFQVRAVTTVHGESDHIAGNVTYEADLIQWQADYESDVNALTGRAGTLPLFQTQMSSWTKFGQATSAIPYAQLAAHVDRPGKIVVVGPKYHLAYAPDGVHLTNQGYRHMGEDYAKAYRRVVVEGGTWEPVRPKSVTRVDKVVTVTFHVPAPPLVLDTTLVTNPGNFGFEFVDDAAVTPGIASVALVAQDAVQITLTATPTGANKRVHYAAASLAGANGGPTTGPRGNLRDSDATPSRNGYALYNWCVHFLAPVP